jgi:hypothetical protein
MYSPELCQYNIRIWLYTHININYFIGFYSFPNYTRHMFTRMIAICQYHDWGYAWLISPLYILFSCRNLHSEELL